MNRENYKKNQTYVLRKSDFFTFVAEPEFKSAFDETLSLIKGISDLLQVVCGSQAEDFALVYLSGRLKEQLSDLYRLRDELHTADRIFANKEEITIPTNTKQLEEKFVEKRL